MADQTIRFTDGASYERMMGVWSRAAGAVFLDWVAPQPQLAWADIGSGNGAFTELVVERAAPKSIIGIDPSPQQLSYAHERHAAGIAEFAQGNAMALPLGDASVDIASMALVIFFVPDAAKGVAEMARIVRPGGLVAAYAWDLLGGGFPWEPVHAELRPLGFSPPLAPNPEAAAVDTLRRLWGDAGLVSVETRTITVERIFSSFDDFWATALLAPTLASVLTAIDPAVLAGVRERLRATIPAEDGRVVASARANAVKGIVPS